MLIITPAIAAQKKLLFPRGSLVLERGPNGNDVRIDTHQFQDRPFFREYSY